jgi:hypothetical protein
MLHQEIRVWDDVNKLVRLWNICWFEKIHWLGLSDILNRLFGIESMLDTLKDWMTSLVLPLQYCDMYYKTVDCLNLANRKCWLIPVSHRMCPLYPRIFSALPSHFSSLSSLGHSLVCDPVCRCFPMCVKRSWFGSFTSVWSRVSLFPHVWKDPDLGHSLVCDPVCRCFLMCEKILIWVIH